MGTSDRLEQKDEYFEVQVSLSLSWQHKQPALLYLRRLELLNDAHLEKLICKEMPILLKTHSEISRLIPRVRSQYTPGT